MEKGSVSGGRRGPPLLLPLRSRWGEIHRTWNDHQKVYNSAAPGTLAIEINASVEFPKHFHHPKGTRTRCSSLWSPLTLQCTTNGPALGGLLDFTWPDKAQQPSGVVGDPMVWPAWVKWNRCLISLDFVDASLPGAVSTGETQGNRQ